MGKRSAKFERRARDYYRTPYEAVLPLLPHLKERTLFAEPCAGDGVLARHLEKNGHDCVCCFDVEPQGAGVGRGDAFKRLVSPNTTRIITNPPWSRDILHPLIQRLSAQHPTWLLFDADWMHTKQSVPYMSYCQRIISVGRVSWMENGVSGFDNCCWYLFDKFPTPTVFHARTA